MASPTSPHLAIGTARLPPPLPPRPPRSPRRLQSLESTVEATATGHVLERTLLGIGERPETVERPISPLLLSHVSQDNARLPPLPSRPLTPVPDLDTPVRKGCSASTGTDERAEKIVPSENLLPPPRHPVTRPSLSNQNSLDPISTVFHEAADAGTRNVPEAGSSNRSQDETIEELEDQEISDYLHRASKQLQEVTVLQPTQRTQVPTSNLTELSSADWLKVGEAYLLDILDRHCPSSLLGPDKPSPVSVSQLRASLERCYVLAPPALWHTLLEGNLGDLYRWKNPRRSTKYLLGYIVLWIFDLIPSFIIVYLLFVVVDRRLNPPPLAQLKLEADRRRELGAEAEKLGSGGGGMSMLGRGIGASAMMVGAPAIPQFASAVSTTSEPQAQVPKVKDQIGIYSLGRGLYAHYGSPIQLILADFAELGEKMKNLYLWRKPDACWRSCGLMGMIFLYTIFIPQRWVVKNFLGWLGLQFFFIFGFIERYPRFRKTFNPGYWLLYGVPTDAEYALELLRLRARRWGKKREPEELKSLKNVDRTLVTETTKADGHGSLFESERWRGWGKKVVERSSGTYRRLREGQVFEDVRVSPRDATDIASRNSRSHDRDSSESRTFAMLNGRAPGHLIIGTDEIRFEPMKGFRTKVMTSIKSSVGDAPSPRSSLDSPQAVDGAFRPSSPAIFIQARSITRLRKTRSFGLGVIGGDGLEFMLENAEVFLFDNVANRDEVFHLVLSMSALADKRWALNSFT